MIDNASKSITLGERMSPETVWKRFGISPLYSHDDTELLNGFVEVYKTGEGFCRSSMPGRGQGIDSPAACFMYMAVPV